MAEITAAAVKALRVLTDLPMMECKKALVAADGDQDKAVEILRESGKKVSLKRADNPTSEGRIWIEVNEDASQAAMIELQCESAPVAANDEFQSFARRCALQLLKGSGAETPDTLMSQPAPEADGKTLNDVFEDMVNKIREKIVLARLIRVDGPVGGYVHFDGKTGVLFQATGESSDAELLKGVAMHIAALKPTVTEAEELDAAMVQAERGRLTAEAKATGKPDNIIEKIVDGRMKTFYVDQGVLVVQPYVKDEAKSVSQALAEQGLKAAGFTLWVLGT